ncbi:MAG TPA: ATP-binding protein [Armatimonadota bacterium]|nr:ATP-binding protein [Armatimonadota bacterium]
MKSEVQLQIPGRPEFVRVARLTVSGTASCVGFGVDEIDEIKQCVGEACSNAVAAIKRTGEVDIHVRCGIDDERVVIDVSPVAFSPEDIKDERTEFQFFLIKTLMDNVELVPDGAGASRIRMTRSLSR